MSKSRIEEFLEALLSGEATDVVPQSRAEACLKNCIDGTGTEGLPEPQSRLEAYLHALAEKMAGGGGGSSGGDLEITDASYLFYNNTRTDIMDALFATIKNCTTFNSMFYDCKSLTSIPELDTSNGTSFEGMFFGCSSLTSIPELDTSKGTVFEHMFDGCASLTSIPELDTGKGTTFLNMFDGCASLTSIPELDTSNGTVFAYMFVDCASLTSIPKLDTSNGTTFAYMFNNCSSLTSIPDMDVGNGTALSRMFFYCKKLEHLRLYNIRSAIQIGSGTSWGHLLTVDSLVHTIKELCPVSTQLSLSMGAANLDKIADLYCKITDSTNEKLPMELCESTDEGAMTLSDYAAEKNWRLT
jgi:hypothetical protein